MPRRGFATPVVLVGILVLLLIAGGAYYLGKSSSSVSTSPSSATPTLSSPTTDPTATWKTYSGKVYSFKYPTGWFAAERHTEYLGDEAVVNNASRSVVIRVLTGKQPYGIEEPSTFKQSSLKIVIEGKNYNAKEIVFEWKGKVNKGNAVVDFQYSKNGKDYQILLGTGYPAGEDQLSSLSDYYANRETILQILSTFKFTDQSTSPQSNIYTDKKWGFEFQYPAGWTAPSSVTGATIFTIQNCQNAPCATISGSFVSKERLAVMGVTYCGAHLNDKVRCQNIGQAVVDWGQVSDLSRQAFASLPYPKGGLITLQMFPVNKETRLALDQILSTFKFTQ